MTGASGGPPEGRFYTIRRPRVSRNPKGGSRVRGESTHHPDAKVRRMNRLLLLILLAPTVAPAQVQVQASAGFTLDLPVVIPQLVVVTPGIQVVPDVDYEVFHTGGFYWTRHEGRWFRSSNPRSGWVFVPRGVPAGL